MRIADGRRWTIDPEPGKALVRPIWVDGTQLWYRSGVYVNNSLYSETLLRLNIADLGPGEPAR